MKDYQLKQPPGFGRASRRQIEFYRSIKKLGHEVALDAFGNTHVITPAPERPRSRSSRETFDESFRRWHKAIVLAIILAAAPLATAGEFGLKFSPYTVPIRTNSEGVVRAHIATPTQEFWKAWRRDKETLKERGYTCRPSTNGWQILRVKE